MFSTRNFAVVCTVSLDITREIEAEQSRKRSEKERKRGKKKKERENCNKITCREKKGGDT